MSEVYYADSNALLKRHVIEIGSNWIKNEFSAGSNNTVTLQNSASPKF